MPAASRNARASRFAGTIPSPTSFVTATTAERRSASTPTRSSIAGAISASGSRPMRLASHRVRQSISTTPARVRRRDGHLTAVHFPCEARAEALFPGARGPKPGEHHGPPPERGRRQERDRPRAAGELAERRKLERDDDDQAEGGEDADRPVAHDA